jgi:hypothetical protein
MVAILRLLIGALRNCIMSRGRLEAEVIVLRHQLNILRRQSPKRVRPNAFDRAIFVCLYRYFPDTGCPGIAEEPTPASHVLAYSFNAGQQRHSLEGRLLLLAALQDGA